MAQDNFDGTSHRMKSKNNNTFRVVWGPQRFRLSIGWKTLIAFALVVFVPMFGLMNITERTLRDAMEADAFRSLEANLRAAWRVYHERSANVRAALVQSAASPDVRGVIHRQDAEQLRAVLDRHAALLPFVDVWIGLDKSQQVISRRNGPKGGQVFLNNLIARAYTFLETVTSTELLPNQIFVEENPLKYSNLDTQVMAQVIVVPVQHNGDLVGGLVGLILLNEDNWLPNAIHDYLSIDAALFGSLIQESRVISASHRPNNLWATGLLAPTVLGEAIKRGEPFRGKLVINEINAFAISEPILNQEGTPIGALSIGLKGSSIDGLIAGNAVNIYLFILLGATLSLVIAFLAYRDTMTPMRAMMGAMDAFANGNLHVRTDIRTKDEFEGLGEGFNRMAGAIQEHQERVESFNSLTSLLITSLKPKELLQKVLDKVVELTNAQAGLFYLSESESDAWYLVPYVPYAVDIESMPRLLFGQGLPGEAALQRRLIHVRQVPEECKLSVNFGIADALPKEVAIFPIVYRDKVLGVMLLGSLNPFRPSDLSLLEYITNQIAVVLENALTHEQIEKLSITDALTGVYNRRHLTNRLEEEFSKAHRYNSQMSLLLIDIDHFKRINDRFGHQVGDQALVAVAETFCKYLRESDLIGRYGGEEFVVLLPHTSQADAILAADKLRREIQKLKVAGLGEVALSISIGVASYPDHRAESLDEFIQKADRALYQAKEEGRNKTVTAA